MKTTTIAIIALVTVLVAACDDELPVPAPEISAIEALADEYLAALLERNPEMGTFLSIEGARHGRLSDLSLEALDEWQSREEVWLQTLLSIEEPDDVGSRDWVSYSILRETLEAAIARRVCRDELWQASDNNGWHRWLPFLFNIQPVGSEELQQQTLDRLGQVDDYIDSLIANLLSLIHI